MSDEPYSEPLDTERFHEGFLARLDASQPAVKLVAEWLSSRGVETIIKPSSRAPTHAEWRNHSDKGDLRSTVVVEVKHLSCKFTSAADWPFPDIIVCGAHSWDRANPKPWRFFYINPPKTHALIVSGLHSDRWSKEWRKVAHLDNEEREFYICPVDLGRFIKLGD